jgi:methylated-DNA-[protein]-cysteine S-methyltransferase
MDDTFTTALDTAVGTLTVVASNVGVRAVLWPGESYDDLVSSRVRRRPDTASATSADDARVIAARAVEQLIEYFDGRRREFDVPLDPHGTEFQLSVWQVLRTIPYGTTITYGEQARALGDANKARAVGAANGRNPISVIVPCHRVVGGNGSLTGFAGGLDAKSWLLSHERATLAV